MTKITNSNIPFTSKISMLTRDGFHNINGEKVTLNVFHSDSPKCDYFVSIWADADDAIMVDPWNSVKAGEKLVPARYVNLYLKTKEQTKELLAALNPGKIDLHLKTGKKKQKFLDISDNAKNKGDRNFEIEHDEKQEFLDIFNNAKNKVNRNFLIEHDEEKGLLDIKEDSKKVYA